MCETFIQLHLVTLEQIFTRPALYKVLKIKSKIVKKQSELEMLLSPGNNQAALFKWSLRELLKIMFVFFGIFWPHAYSSFHFLFSKSRIVLTIYPTLNASAIYEGSLTAMMPLQKFVVSCKLIESTCPKNK